MAYLVPVQYVGREALADELCRELPPQLLFAVAACVTTAMKQARGDGVDLVLDSLELRVVGRGRQRARLGRVVQLYRVQEDVDIRLLVGELGPHQGDHVLLAALHISAALGARGPLIAAPIFLEYGLELLEGEVAVLDDGRQLARVDAALLLLRVQQAVCIFGFGAEVSEHDVQAPHDGRDLGEVRPGAPGAAMQRPRRAFDSFDGSSGGASNRSHACLGSEHNESLCLKPVVPKSPETRGKRGRGQILVVERAATSSV